MLFGTRVRRRVDDDDLERPAGVVVRQKLQRIAVHEHAALGDAIQLRVGFGELQRRSGAVNKNHFFRSRARSSS